jgi:predicted NBD/HSP70 family sugar kinase
VLRTVADGVEELVASVHLSRDRILGVALATHGPQDRENGRLLTPQPTPAWHDFPLTQTLEDMLRVPAVLENDATAAAVGELWLDSVSAERTFGVIYMASGIGGGCVVGGTTYRGATSNGLEIGHISLDANGPRCSCGNRGCLENFAGPRAIVEQALADAELAARLDLSGAMESALDDFTAVGRAAASGDSQARAIIEGSAHYFATAAVTFANLFDLELVVLAGPSFVVAGDIYRQVIQEELGRAAFVRLTRTVSVALSASGDDAAALGGAVLLMRHLPGMVSSRPDAALRYEALGRLLAN